MCNGDRLRPRSAGDGVSPDGTFRRPPLVLTASAKARHRMRRDRVRERLRLARHPDNSPAILYPACLKRLLADRSLNSVRNGSDAITLDALGHEIITDRIGSPLSERLVRPSVSPLVRMALDEDARAPIRCEPCGGPVEVTPRRRAELGMARVEVGDDDLEARQRRRDWPAGPSAYHRPQPQHQVGVG